MGNSSRKGRPPRTGGRHAVGTCWGAGTSASAQQSSTSPFSGAGSALNQAPQQNQSISPQADIASLVERLQADPKDVTKFKEILTFIDQALEKHQNHSKFNLQVPDLINGNLEDAEKTLTGIYELCKARDGVGSAQIELQKVLSDAFGGLGNLHWITAAFSVVAFVLKRVDNTKENKESCLDILVKVQKLGHHLVDLFELIPIENLKFWQAGASILEAAIFCVNELNVSYLKRFTFMNVRMGDISKFKEQIPHVYQDLTLTVEKENARRTTQPLPFYKPEDPHIIGREEIISNILEAMRTAPKTHQAILLHGIGGIGKTTIAEKIVEESKGQFNGRIAKVEIGDKPGHQDICNCQRTIIERLGGSKPNIGDMSEGRQLLHDYLKQCSSPVLLFVDNVFEDKDLEDLLPRESFSVLPKDSYILVTSRTATVSGALRVEGAGGGVQWKEFPVDGLKESPAEALLQKRLGGCPEVRREQFLTILGICNGCLLLLKWLAHI